MYSTLPIGKFVSRTMLPLFCALMLLILFSSGCDLTLVSSKAVANATEANVPGDLEPTGITKPFRLEPTAEPEFVFVAVESADPARPGVPTYQAVIRDSMQITPIVIPYQPAPKVIVPPSYQPPLVPQPLSQPPGLPYHAPIYQPPISQPILPPSFYP